MAFVVYKALLALVGTYLIFLTALYFWYLIEISKFDVSDGGKATQVIVYILSIALLLATGICIWVLIIKETTKCLGTWASLVVVMGISAIAQVGITAAAYRACEDDSDANLLCAQKESTAIWTIYIPMTLLFICGALGCVTACVYKNKLKDSGSLY